MLAIRFYNGRNTPDEELDDWGFDGPTFGIAYFASTYDSHVRVGDEDGNAEMSIDEMTVDSLVHFPGWGYFSDYKIYALRPDDDPKAVLDFLTVGEFLQNLEDMKPDAADPIEMARVEGRPHLTLTIKDGVLTYQRDPDLEIYVIPASAPGAMIPLSSIPWPKWCPLSFASTHTAASNSSPAISADYEDRVLLRLHGHGPNAIELYYVPPGLIVELIDHDNDPEPEPSARPPRRVPVAIPTATVEVSGGVAEVTSCPDGFRVNIIDHD